MRDREHGRPTGQSFRVNIDGETTGLKFSASHFIKGHEQCGYLHGHNYTVRVEVDGTLDNEGMVIDFFEIESAIKSLIHDMDHRILIARRHAKIRDKVIAFDSEDGTVTVPKRSVLILDLDETTAELIASYLLKRLVLRVKFARSRISRIAIGVCESDGRTSWSQIEL
jgi:6-pyruvoyltetrahydropterin/6-carboxytetrahydropterin synthase